VPAFGIDWPRAQKLNVNWSPASPASARVWLRVLVFLRAPVIFTEAAPSFLNFVSLPSLLEKWVFTQFVGVFEEPL
jgi:hypothetical protein